MKLLTTLTISTLLALPYAAGAESDDFDLAGIMATSKFTGGCGILSQMARFQETTEMDGGDEFILRFMNTEAARLGKTLEEYMQQCASQTEIYKAWYEFAVEMAEQ